MSLCCQQDDRRDAVRRMNGLNGLDYVEVRNDQVTLDVFFLGKLPPELASGGPAAVACLVIEGGQRVTEIRVLSAEAIVNPDPELDDVLVVTVDKYGDFSTYTLRLVNVDNIDPRYDRAEFSFKVNCPSDLDCAAVCACDPVLPPAPEINYLAKDYGSFRQLILDRLAVLMPDWKERHAADIGIALVEVLAYTGDYLSYYQDAVATEAYLDTARRRISVRRHARLVDYHMHEGSNARAFVCVEVTGDLEIEVAGTAFVTGYNNELKAKQTILIWDDLRETPADTFEVFEPLVHDRSRKLHFRAAHNEIRFFTWGLKECCLEKGSTSAALVDARIEPAPGQEDSDEGSKSKYDPKRRAAGQPRGKASQQRALDLHPGDVLIFEEVLGAKTGLPGDADPSRRHAVRLTKVTPGEDPVTGSIYVEVEWAAEDALPFPFCVSTLGPAPGCPYLADVSVARGNVVLVDHGRTQNPEDLGTVPTVRTEAICECAGQPGDVREIPGKFRAHLAKKPLTFSQPLPEVTWAPAASLLKQDVRLAAPQVWLTSEPSREWESRHDLIGSGATASHFVIEIDNDGLAHLRFGDSDCGLTPPAGMAFSAVYRTGNGAAGNVGAESISRLVLKDRLSGVSVTVRNPLAARGGTAAEPITEAKLIAPSAFRQRLERAITSDDYETIAERNAKVQLASADLAWTGSWYEADVAIDPLGHVPATSELITEIEAYLERYRRMGHDLRALPARYVPLDLKLEVCALPGYDRGHVKRALLDVFSTRALPGGKLGFFHPDKLTFGEGIYLSVIIATAQAVPGVECVEITRLRRLYEAPNREIENGVLPLDNAEIARLDNDPSFPERGKLDIVVRGGR